MNIIVKLVNHKEIKELKEAFRSIDTDNSGTISIKELFDAIELMNLDIKIQDIREIMARNSMDWREQMSYTEFIAATLTAKKEIDIEIL